MPVAQGPTTWSMIGPRREGPVADAEEFGGLACHAKRPGPYLLSNGDVDAS
jgi:hypothetical protein